MDNPFPLSPPPSQPSTVHHTPTGTPYISLATSSTQPIYLTPFYPTDIPTLQSTLSLSQIHQHLVAVPHPYTLADAEFWVNLQLSGEGNLLLQVLRYGDPETGKLIGCVSLMPDDSETLIHLREKIPNLCAKEEEVQLGYYLHPEFRGKGIMTSAVKAVLSWGASCGVRNVVVKVLEENASSRGVIERVPEFVRQEKDDEWVDWPVEKGGGKRKVLAWRWEMQKI